MSPTTDQDPLWPLNPTTDQDPHWPEPEASVELVEPAPPTGRFRDWLYRVVPALESLRTNTARDWSRESDVRCFCMRATTLSQGLPESRTLLRPVSPET